MKPRPGLERELRPDGGLMDATVLVLLYVADPEGTHGSVEAAYHAVSRALRGTPGLAGNVLLRSVDDPRAFVIVSRWTDINAFRTWEKDAAHRATTAPLRPLQIPAGGTTFGIYQVTASY
jgi:heme-degrading monooxygenase HmoA